MEKARTILTRLNEVWTKRLCDQLVELEQPLLIEAADGQPEFEAEGFWETLYKLRDLAMANWFIFGNQQAQQASSPVEQPVKQPVKQPVEPQPVEPQPVTLNASQVLFNGFASLIGAIQNGQIDLAVNIARQLLGVTWQRAENCVGYLRDQMGFSPAVFAKIICLRQAIVDKDRLTAPLLEDIFGLERHEALASAETLHAVYARKQ